MDSCCIGPPKLAPSTFSAKGAGRSSPAARSTRLVALSGSRWANQNALPCHWLPPRSVMRLTTLPELRPNSALYWLVIMRYSANRSVFVNWVAAPPNRGSLLSTLSIMKLFSRPREPLTAKGTSVLAKLNVRTLNTPGASRARLLISRVSSGSSRICFWLKAVLSAGEFVSIIAISAALTSMVSFPTGATVKVISATCTTWVTLSRTSEILAVLNPPFSTVRL